MENLSLLLFLSVAVPLGMMLFVCKERTRLFLGFFLTGTVVALFCGELNGFIKPLLPFSGQYYSINIAPIVEEFCKGLPILFFAFAWKPERQTLLAVSVAVGIGFAVLENAFVFASSTVSIPIVTALLRAFGAGMMHGICTLAVGYGMSYVHERRKIFFSGTVALLAAAIVYHSIYNNFVISGHTIEGVILPTVSFIPTVLIRRVQKKKKCSTEQ